ncbi:MAG: DUF4129 domain-containing transglutaminase family protein [Planctomycetota bacterium]
MKSRFRNRLYPTIPPSPLDPWINFGLTTLASSGAAAAALTLDLQFGVMPVIAWLCSFGLVYLPYLGRRFRILHGSDEGDRLQAYALLLLPGTLMCLFLPVYSAGSISLIFILSLHGYLLRFARPGGAAVMAILMPALEVLFAIDAVWERGWLARLFGATWMMLILLGGAVVITWLHARSTRRTLPTRFFSDQQPAETEAGLWQRAKLVLGLSLLLLPLGIVLQQGALLITPNGSDYAGLGDPSDPKPVTKVDESEPEVEPEPEEIPEEEEQPPSEPRFTYPEDVTWAGSLSQPGESKNVVLAEIRCSSDVINGEESMATFGSANPLYLVATTLDTLSATGLSRSMQGESIYYADSGVGSRDWTVFAPDALRGPRTEFKIRLRNMPLDRGDASRSERVLLHNRRLVAMKHPRVRLGADGTALTEVTDDILNYSWFQVDVSYDIPLMPAGVTDASLSAIPNDDPRFDIWADEARALCADLTDPEDKLQRIVAHFRRKFYYDPHPSQANGIEAFSDFLATRSGYCTYFASGAMLYLRANGIPARVATGFMVTEFNQERGSYYARLSDAHAWVEVQQADGSFRTIEPTPTSRRREALNALLAGQDYETLPPQVASGKEPSKPSIKPEEPELEAKKEGTEHALEFAWIRLSYLVMTGGMSIPAAFLLFNLVRLIGSFRKGHRPREHFEELSAEAATSLAYWVRIQELLAHLGFHRRRSQTSSEFAHQVVRWSGDGMDHLPRVARLVYRTRFGGHAWAPAEQVFLDRFEEHLERKVRES